MKGDLHLVIPVLNERGFLNLKGQDLKALYEHCLAFDVNFMIVDGGSHDGSLEFLIQSNLPFKSVRLEKPNVAKTLLLAKKECTNGHVWVTPIDCLPTFKHLNTLIELLKKKEKHENLLYGAFTKTYDHKGMLLCLQQFYLNEWRLKRKHQFVWTNCPFIPCDELFSLLEKYPEFLSDVRLARTLAHSNMRLKVVARPILCSTRRYQKKGVLKQIMKNFAVMVGERLGLSLERLKIIYKN